MSVVVALIDGEHYPPVVSFALASLAAEHQVAAAVFVGGTEKIDPAEGEAAYGVPVVRAETPEDGIREAIARYRPHALVDLSDEPVLSATDRFRLASVALGLGVEYRGADFRFTPPRSRICTHTPTLAIIGTGKRVGKTAISAHIARHLKAAGHDICVLAMGRGGPDEPELIRGDHVALTTEDLLALAMQGKHASSDNYEDAVMSRVATVGCRRCGGGMAGETFFSNVPEGARLADRLGVELVMLEGSGAAIPPVYADATVLVIGAAQGVPYAREHFGPYRLGLADAVIVAGVEPALVGADELPELIAAIRQVREDVPVVLTTFRPKPIEPVAGERVFFATTAPAPVMSVLAEHLESAHGCTVVASSNQLSNRSRLREDMARAAGRFDVFVTELKAAAIDVVAAAGAEAGVPTVLCDNEPVAVDGADLGSVIDTVTRLAMERGSARRS